MPVYNAEKYVAESIKSILNQSDQNFELIIINDGSTDNSEDIILSFSCEKINYIYQENSGAASARNKGLDKASGDFIVLQDADDISLPNRFEILKRHFHSPNIGIVHSDMLIVDENELPKGYWQSRSMEKKRLLKMWRIRQIEADLANRNSSDVNKMVFTRDDGTPLRLAFPNEKLDIVIKKHNLHRITIHGLRHTHASLLFEAGASIKEVQDRLGHSDIQMTMNIYTHVTDTLKEQPHKNSKGTLDFNMWSEVVIKYFRGQNVVTSHFHA